MKKFNEHNYTHKNKNAILVDIKNRDLIKSSVFIVKIIRFAEKTLVTLTGNFTSINNYSITNRIIISAKNYVHNFNIYVNNICVNDSLLENHRLELITMVCKEYLKIRLHHVAKSKTASIITKCRLLTKLFVFNNQ